MKIQQWPVDKVFPCKRNPRRSEDNLEALEIQVRPLHQVLRVEALATQLDVRPSAIYHHSIGSATAPRRTHAEILQRFALERGSRLTMDDIYGYAREVRENEIKPVTEIVRSRAA